MMPMKQNVHKQFWTHLISPRLPHTVEMLTLSACSTPVSNTISSPPATSSSPSFASVVQNHKHSAQPVAPTSIGQHQHHQLPETTTQDRRCQLPPRLVHAGQSCTSKIPTPKPSVVIVGNSHAS